MPRQLHIDKEMDMDLDVDIDNICLIVQHVEPWEKQPYLSVRKAFRGVSGGREHSFSANWGGTHRHAMCPAVNDLALQPCPKA